MEKGDEAQAMAWRKWMGGKDRKGEKAFKKGIIYFYLSVQRREPS